jgi:hypothetical protein
MGLLGSRFVDSELIAEQAIADRDTLFLSKRWREDPGEILPLAVVIDLGIALLVTAISWIAALFIGRPPYGALLLSTFVITFAVMMFPAAGISNSLTNNRIVRARARVKQIKIAALAAEQRERDRLNRIATTIRLPLLEWAVENDMVDKIGGLADRLAFIVDDVHIQPAEKYNAKLVGLINQSTLTLPSREDRSAS